MNSDIHVSPEHLYLIDQEQVVAEHDHQTADPKPRSADDLKLLGMINTWIPPRKLNDAAQQQRDM